MPRFYSAAQMRGGRVRGERSRKTETRAIARVSAAADLVQPRAWIAPLMTFTLSPILQLGGVGWVNMPLVPSS